MGVIRLKINIFEFCKNHFAQGHLWNILIVIRGWWPRNPKIGFLGHQGKIVQKSLKNRGFSGVKSFKLSAASGTRSSDSAAHSLFADGTTPGYAR